MACDQPAEVDEDDLDGLLTTRCPARMLPFRRFFFSWVQEGWTYEQGCPWNGNVAMRIDESRSESDPRRKILLMEREVEGKDCGEQKDDCEPRTSRSGRPRRGSSGVSVLHRPPRSSLTGFIRGGRIARAGRPLRRCTGRLGRNFLAMVQAPRDVIVRGPAVSRSLTGSA